MFPDGAWGLTVVKTQSSRQLLPCWACDLSRQDMREGGGKGVTHKQGKWRSGSKWHAGSKWGWTAKEVGRESRGQVRQTRVSWTSESAGRDLKWILESNKSPLSCLRVVWQGETGATEALGAVRGGVRVVRCQACRQCCPSHSPVVPGSFCQRNSAPAAPGLSSWPKKLQCAFLPLQSTSYSTYPCAAAAVRCCRVYPVL